MSRASYVRRKCFISYHHEDEAEVVTFINTFDTMHNLFIHRMLGGMNDDIINSHNPDYVMSRIRQEYLRDSTVTLVMIGRCTWARRYVDWEIQSSLRQGETITPNGLLGIILPSATQSPRARSRLDLNLETTNGPASYADWAHYPGSGLLLSQYIEEAYQKRISHRHLIKKPRN